MRTLASAPSKLMLTGEYAVLFGAPATVAALDLRVKASVEDAVGPGWSVRSDLDGRARRLLRAPDGGLRTEDGRGAEEDPALRIPALLLADYSTRADLPPLDLVLESRELRAADGVTKLGVGSSAAACVALDAALCRHLVRRGDLDPAALGSPLDRVARLHRELQDGRGSGADVAASFHGGVVAFVRTNRGFEVRAVTPPATLAWAAVWTRQAASTATYLAALERARRERPDDVARVLELLGARAVECASALEEGPISRILAAIDAYREGLDVLGEVMETPVLTPPHRALAGLAAAEGAVYKPSGAGGGDVGVIFADSETVLRRALHAAERAGGAPLPVKVDPRGASLDEER